MITQLLLINISNMVISIAFSIIAPFYPSNALDHGIKSTKASLTFTFYPLGFIITSIIMIQLQTKIPKKIIFTFTLLTVASVSILLGLIDILKSQTIYYYITLCSRFWQGAASSAFQSAAYSYIAQNQQQTDFIIGTFETSATFGFMIGPIIGSTLYSYIGYSKTFYLIGILVLLLSGLVHYFFQGEQNFIQAPNFQLTKVLLNKKVFLTWFNVLLAYLCISMLESRLARYLYDYGVMQNQVGYYFAISAISYGLVLPILFNLNPKVDRRSIIIIGIFGSALSLLAISNDRIDSLNLISAGLLFLGFSNALQIIPAVSQMIKETTKEHQLITRSSNCVGALMNTAFGIGEVAGPFLSGNIEEMSDLIRIIYIILFCFGVVYLALSFESFKTWSKFCRNDNNEARIEPVEVVDIQLQETSLNETASRQEEQIYYEK